MKKIAFFKHDITIVGGSERTGINLINELLNEMKDVKFYIFSLRKKNKLSVYEINNKVEIIYVNKNNLRLRFCLIKVFYELIKIIKKEKIDIIINVGMATAIYSCFLKLFINIKIISCEHSNILNKINNNYIQKINQRIASLFSDKIVTLTKKDMDGYIKKYNIKKEKIDYIHNFIDDDLSNLKYEYNIQSKKIITVGRFDKVKGYDRLVRIAKDILEKNKEWEWDIYGDGEEFENIKKLIKINNLEKKLILKGNSNKIYEIYKEYSFYVMTSYYEGLPMVLLEAKANFLPIISFDCYTGPSEIIRNDVDGYLIKNDDINEMVEKINLLIHNSEQRQEFSKNSRGNIDKFKKEKIIKKWKELFEEIK